MQIKFKVVLEINSEGQGISHDQNHPQSQHQRHPLSKLSKRVAADGIPDGARHPLPEPGDKRVRPFLDLPTSHRISQPPAVDGGEFHLLLFSGSLPLVLPL